MTALPPYKVLPIEDSVIIYFPRSMDIISIKPEEFKQTSEEQLLEYSEKFLEESHNKKMQAHKHSASSKLTLNKLMVSMSDNCDLDCGYCYASKYFKKENMSKDTINKIIEKFLLSESVEKVKSIIFFGGEPLLNLEGIEYFTSKLDELVAAGKLLKLPDFGIITNGTIFSERISRLIKKYNMFITVSCDGPAEIHDQQRMYRGSKRGSHDIVSRNIKRMSNDGLNVNIECTVTKKAFDAGYNHKKLDAYFRSEFKVNQVFYIPEDMVSPETTFDFDEGFYETPIRYFTLLENLDFQDMLFDTPYRLLQKRPRMRSCWLGQLSFHIQANGMISPCQLISGLEEYTLTHIDSFNDSFFHDNTWVQQYTANSKKCDTCWIKSLCEFCPARLLLEYNSFTMPEKLCDKRIKEIEDLIINVVKLRQDTVRWQDFTQRLKEKRQQIEEVLAKRN